LWARFFSFFHSNSRNSVHSSLFIVYTCNSTTELRRKGVKRRDSWHYNARTTIIGRRRPWPLPVVAWQLTPLSRNPREYPHIPYISRNSNHCPAFCRWPFVSIFTQIVLVVSEKRLFLQEWRFGCSRSSKVIDYGTNRKHVCDFLLVHHSNLGPIFHRFGDIAGCWCSWPHPYSTLILGVFPLHQIAHLGVSQSNLCYSAVKLFSKYSNLCDHGTWTSRTDRQRDGRTDGRTDGQTTYWHICALRSIVR